MIRGLYVRRSTESSVQMEGKPHHPTEPSEYGDHPRKAIGRRPSFRYVERIEALAERAFEHANVRTSPEWAPGTTETPFAVEHALALWALVD